VRPRSESALQFPPFQIQFVEDAVPEVDIEPQPPTSLHKPYWLMRILLKSMTSGGYVTPTLYVPRVVWYQRNVRCQAYSLKMNACSSILHGLARLRKCNVTNTNQLTTVCLLVTVWNLCVLVCISICCTTCRSTGRSC